MLSIKELAIMLFIGHIGSVVFILSVIRRQLALLRLPIDATMKNFRHVLLVLSMAIFVGNIIPIAIDGLTLFVSTGRPAHVRLASIAYAVSNAVIELLSAFLIWKLYQLAADTKEMTDYTQHALEKDNAILGKQS